MSERCVQCGWTIRPGREEDVWRGVVRIPLHKGGCPRPDPLTENKGAR